MLLVSSLCCPRWLRLIIRVHTNLIVECATLYAATSNFGVYFAAAFWKSLFFSAQS
jgi:hypothetical protein